MKSPNKITAYQCIHEEGEVIEERLLSITSMDNDGKVLQREQYDEEGKLIKKFEYQYQGDLVLQTTEENPIEKNVNKTICEYQDDKLTNQKEYLNDDLTIEMVYTYNEEGQLIQHDVLNNDGSLSSRYTYKYSGLTTVERFLDEALALVRKIETTKDEDGQITEKKVTEIFEDREEVNAQTIEYKMEDGESIKNYYNNGKEVYEVVECFDEEGRVIETVTFDLVKSEESIVNVAFDENGKVNKESILINDEEISVTNVKFDEHGNRVEIMKQTKVADDFFETSSYKFVNEYGEKV